MYPPDALTALHQLRLIGAVVDTCVPRFQSDVQGTDPPAGTQVAAGSTVTVYVGVVCDPNSTAPTTPTTTEPSTTLGS
jgi:hypothetical protein